MTAPPAVVQRALVPLLAALMLCGAAAKTILTPPPNNYSPSEDAELGKDAAAEVRKLVPLLTQDYINAYVDKIGRRLLDQLPANIEQPLFQYSFEVVNLQQVGGVALPGGPIFISRGTIETADTEGQLAGVLAHLLSHVVLRHATAQASANERFQIGAITGRSIGAVAGGQTFGVLAQGSNFAVRSYFLTYDASLERQADALSAHLMARAGFDPHDLVAMFESLSDESVRRGGWQWLFSHPGRGRGKEQLSRGEWINRDAETVAVGTSGSTSDRFPAVRARLEQVPSAHRAGRGSWGQDPRTLIGRTRLGFGVVVPSGESRSVTAGDLLQLSVPANWHRVPAGNAVAFAPEGAFLQLRDGPTAFTHGILVGNARSLTGDLEGDTQLLLQSLNQDNPQFRWSPVYQRLTIAERSGVTTVASSVSPVSGDFEQVTVWTTHLPDGSLLYVIGVSPQDEGGTYRKAFDRVLESIQIVG